jgi:2'-5' RNA ligase
MPTFEKASEAGTLAIGSYQTSLCIIPPGHLCRDIDRFRMVYDRAHGKWPPHINLIYPFVSIDNLPRSIELIQSKLLTLNPESGHINIHLRLDTLDYFSHRQGNTIFIAPNDEGGGRSLKSLRGAILEAFKNGDEIQEYRPHLTIGQSPANASPFWEYLLGKASLLLPLELRVEELIVLVRERTPEQGHASTLMKIWGTVGLSGDTAITAERLLPIS